MRRRGGGGRQGECCQGMFLSQLLSGCVKPAGCGAGTQAVNAEQPTHAVFVA